LIPRLQSIPVQNPGPKGYAGTKAYQPQGGADLSDPEEERREAARALEAATKLANEQGSLAHGTTQVSRLSD
jgi:hypothetical protein